MTIKETLRKGMIQLKTGNVTEPNLKARLIMQYVLNKPRQYLIIYDDQVLTLRQEVDYFKAIKRLINGEPIQHITHQQEFMKLSFFVNEDVLIPRPDTEILVEEVIKIAKKIKAKNILDMCTGSGAIAVSLAKYLDNVEITAVDISTKTLNVAKTNAKNNEVENKITFIESNLFENIVNEKYDIIVSNPPYIKKDVIKTLNKEVQKEPKIALDGGYDGLDFYRKITHQSEEYLKFNGYLCFEIGYDQKKDVIKIINDERKFTGTYSKKDLCDNDRIVVTRLD
ncbi:MAG: peptide chain release factor N(5)-glutamine methyltransferase [Clostridiales bacterium]|nr:peptide chain release factor N(5)-glutamine methyltransferase [Clostridiales bacterium]